MNNNQESPKLSLTETLINNAFEDVIKQHRKLNEDCELLSQFLLSNLGILTHANVSPVKLLQGYNTLGKDDEPSESLKEKLEKAFGAEIGKRFFYEMKVAK